MQSLRGFRIASGIALATVISFSAGRAQSADVEITPQARAHFRAGVNFLDDPDGARYGEAYREFKAAYALAPSWKIIGNIGLTAMKLERDGEAIAAYEQYLKEGGDQIDKDERAQVERDLQTLQAGVVTVVIDVQPAGAVLVDERLPDSGSNVINRYEPQGSHFEIGVHAGRHRITARLDGYQDETWTFETQGQRNFSHAFQLSKATGPADGGGGRGQATSRPIPGSVWVVGGLSAAAAVGGGVVGVLAVSKRSEYDTANKSQVTAADHQNASNLRTQGQRLDLIADICFAGAAVGAGVTLALIATRPTRAEHVSSAGGPSLALTPVVGTRTAGAFLSGRF